MNNLLAMRHAMCQRAEAETYKDFVDAYNDAMNNFNASDAWGGFIKLGHIDATTGEEDEDTKTQEITPNYYKVRQPILYCCCLLGSGSNFTVEVFCYDKDFNYLGRVVGQNTGAFAINIKDGTEFIRVMWRFAYSQSGSPSMAKEVAFSYSPFRIDYDQEIESDGGTASIYYVTEESYTKSKSWKVSFDYCLTSYIKKYQSYYYFNPSTRFEFFSARYYFPQTTKRSVWQHLEFVVPKESWVLTEQLRVTNYSKGRLLISNLSIEEVE